MSRDKNLVLIIRGYISVVIFFYAVKGNSCGLLYKLYRINGRSWD